VQVCGRIARDAYVRDVFNADAGDFETIADGLRGKTGAMLDAIEALLFNRRDNETIFD